MKKSVVPIITCSLLAMLTLIVGCDYSSGSGDNNFNTRGLASIANISGFYRGTFQGRAVKNTSRGNINSFTIQQSGNRVEVVDNQGSTYVGTVGSPLLVIPPGSTSIPEGAAVSTYQISFSGKDGVANKDVEFSGVITLVAVTDVQGTTETRTSQNNDTTTVTQTTTVTNSTPQQTGVDGVEPGTDESTTTESVSEDVDNRETTQTTGFSLTDSNTQLRMRGTWKEIGGVVSDVDALAAGVMGNLTFTGGGSTGGDGGADGGGGASGGTGGN